MLFPVHGVDLPGREPEQMPWAEALVGADLSTAAGVRQAAEQIRGHAGGGIDILVNNAGVAATRPWREVLGVNALAPRDLTRLLAPSFSQGAAVVSVASQAALAWRANYARARALLALADWQDVFASFEQDPQIQQRCYQISKEAVVADMLELVTEHRGIGLRANTVSPGTVATPLLGDFTESMGADVIEGARSWAGRHAEAEEVADAIVFLASPAASWISGVELPVDGGYGAQVFKMMNPIDVEVAR